MAFFKQPSEKPIIYKKLCKFFYFFKQRLYIFSLKISNEHKQRLYKIQKHPTSLFYRVLLKKQNECMWRGWNTLASPDH